MIAANSLAAFTAEVSRSQAIAGARIASPTEPAGPARPAQRSLDALPPAPTRPLPRGSLLDLSV